jgi:hypothetical protein
VAPPIELSVRAVHVDRETIQETTLRDVLGQEFGQIVRQSFTDRLGGIAQLVRAHADDAKRVAEGDIPAEQVPGRRLVASRVVVDAIEEAELAELLLHRERSGRVRQPVSLYATAAAAARRADERHARMLLESAEEIVGGAEGARVL